MKVAKAHCLFEQSGVFRDAFIRNGIPAECYDISNDFGKTDHVVDIFSEIEKAYGGVEACSTGSRRTTSSWLSSPARGSRRRYRSGSEALHTHRGHGAPRRGSCTP